MTDLPKNPKNQIKMINNDNNNSFQDFDDIDFDMDEDDEDTHIPKFFIKDKNIIQLNDYPELINDLDNHALGVEYEQSDI